MSSKLTIHELEVFLQIAETRNFRIAAEQANVSQPALSRTLQSAEWKLSARLFDRNTRKVELSSAGQELLPIARRIVSEFRGALSDLSEFIAGRKGNITVAALPSAAAALLPRAMAEFSLTHPFVTVTLQPLPAEKVLEVVCNGTVDFALSTPPTLHEEINYEPLLRDQFVLICRKADPISSTKKMSWSIFAERPFIASGSFTSVRQITNRVLAETGQNIMPRYESPNLAVLGAMVAEGLGISAVPRLALRLIDASQLAIIELASPLVHRDIGILTRKNRSLPAAAPLFFEVLRSQHTVGAQSLMVGVSADK
jgi:LysR family carnitine catabolism transcriptional activator